MKTESKPVLSGDPVQLRWHIIHALFGLGDDVEVLIEIMAWISERWGYDEHGH